MLVIVIAAACTTTTAPAAKLGANNGGLKPTYWFESTKCAGPGCESSMYRFDPTTQNVSQVQVTGITPWKPGYSEAYNSGAALCGNTYYAVWTDIEQSQDGIAKIVLSDDGTGVYSQTMLPPGPSGSPFTADVYHRVWCDPADATKLFAVRSSPAAGNETRAHFSLRHVDTSSGNDTKLFDFADHGDWATSDTTFDYDPKTGQFWSTWAATPPKFRPFEKSSIIDMIPLGSNYTAGPLKTWNLPANGGFLYSIYANTGDGQFRATLHHGKLPDDVHNLKWADLTLKADGSVAVQEKQNVEAILYTGGQAVAQCGSLLWSVPETGDPNAAFIYGINALSEGKVEFTIDLSKYATNFLAGAVAC